jgi:hemolysin activation/secretion protein
MRFSKFILFCAAAFSLAASASVRAQEVAVPRFDITRFQVDGNTLLKADFVDHLLRAFAGKQRDFGDVQRALETLEDAYRKRGYNAVQVTLPEQELERGTIRFKVLESKLAKVNVEGNRHFSEQNIRNSMPTLRVSETPNIAKISANLRVANDNPSKKINLQLQSGDKEEDIIASMKVTDEAPWKVGATFDNTGTQQTGKTRLGVLFQHTNVLDRDQVLSLQYTTSPEKLSQVGIYSVGYRVPLYAAGDALDIFAGYSDVDSGSISAGVYDLKVSGRGFVSGIRYNQNLGRYGNYEPKLVYGLDYRAYKNSVSLVNTPLGNDVTVHPVSLTYSGAWTRPTGESGFYLTAVRNLPGGDKGRDADFNLSRAGAPAGYSVVRYGANFSQLFAETWQMRLTFSGQYAWQKLISGEQFGVGGSSSVRGFLERELAKDKGHLLSGEIYTPNLCTGWGMESFQCRALGFYDVANVTLIDPLPGEDASATIASYGLGLRMMRDRNFNLGMDYGRVHKAGGVQGKGDERMHFRMGLLF